MVPSALFHNCCQKFAKDINYPLRVSFEALYKKLNCFCCLLLSCLYFLSFILFDLFIIQDLFETSLEFSKLEKVEIGGVKGKALSHDVVQVFDEFTEAVAVFANRTYDTLNPLEKVC